MGEEPTDVWQPPNLDGRVAVVTGASRGVGRGIARVLGACGATVYVGARSRRGGDAPSGVTVDDVVEEIHQAGGEALAAGCDLADDAQITDLFDRIGREQGRVDILVNNAVGWEAVGDDAMQFVFEPPWQAPDGWWEANFDVGVRSHWMATRKAAPLMLPHRRGLVAFTSERQPPEPGAQELVMDLRATVLQRMALLFSLHLRPHGIASMLLYPGWTRTEAIETAFEQGGPLTTGWTREEFEVQTASPDYAGRATASLAADPDIMTRTGRMITAFEAACEYGFTDVTGTRPDPE